MNIFQFLIDEHAPRSTFSLNGTWHIAGGTELEMPKSFPSEIPVPAVVDTAVPAYDWPSYEFHWYRTTFHITNLSFTQFVFLKIGQSMFGTEVWLNGRHLGGSISCYTSHEYPLNEFLAIDSPNELVIRVGAKQTLPPESAVGRDQEKEIYTPGIWGDVSILCVGGARVQLVQVIPHIDTATAEIRAWIQNLEYKREQLLVSARIFERKSDESASPIHDVPIVVGDHAVEQVVFHLPVESMKLWSPDHPFLYDVEVTVQEGNKNLDRMRAAFGMREFKISGTDFYLNGQKILLRGSNIAFHRFLSDQQRKLLPWDESWIKKVLIDIPKEHHFNFFRNHIGQMYSKWYDTADEYGMLLQNEWQFWCATGSDAQIRKEFTEWLQDNWNHPSIIMWDPLNESSDDTIHHEIVPEMKQLDPTRPWESVDFLEEHPYIYSLGMVMNNRRFGFSRPLEEMKRLPVPSMVNEFLWWWFNDQWEPTSLTTLIVERWMGREYTKADVIAHQSFLAQELIELFRRLHIKAIQPFVYLSNNDGPTAHWFLGDIKDLQPKPLLTTIKNAFAPFGISIELWDRHFFTREQRSINIFVFNDSNTLRSGRVVAGIKTPDGKWLHHESLSVEVPPVSDKVVPFIISFPEVTGDYFLAAVLEENHQTLAVSTKKAHVFDPPVIPDNPGTILLFDPSKEIQQFLDGMHVPYRDFNEGFQTGYSSLIVHGNVAGNRSYIQRRDEITRFVKQGGTLVLIEPEYRVVGSAENTIVEGIDLKIFYREDVDKGGYDSYVFAEDQSHPLWKNILKDHLKLFNGAYGGEIVSQYTVEFSVPAKKLAGCGIGLNVAAVSETEFGKGKIILFRLQLRGRLMPHSNAESFYARRVDPVAQQLLVNLLEYSAQ